MQTNSTTEKPPVAKAFNGIDRNSFLYGLESQELNYGMVVGNDWLYCISTLGYNWLVWFRPIPLRWLNIYLANKLGL